MALSLGNPYTDESKKHSRMLLQAAVVLLGFTMNLQQVLKAGVEGLGFALVSISLVLGAAYLLGKLLKLRADSSLLVGVGTAICGGSAIAAVSTVIDADQEDISVSAATVFLLNAVALLIFPLIGHRAGLSDHQFGVWAGIGIHDVSSVVGAATIFGPGAVTTATAVKLSRVLYLVPLTLIIRQTRKTGGKAAPLPWFIGLFLVAAAMASYVPGFGAVTPYVSSLAVMCLSLSLFLVGAGISRKALKQVGVRPIGLGVVLWAMISVLAFLYVKG